MGRFHWIWLIVFTVGTGIGCVGTTEADDTPRPTSDGASSDLSNRDTYSAPEVRSGSDAVASDTSDAVEPPLPYAASVVEFLPGEGAGYGSNNLPEVVLGPPSADGVAKPSLDVLSLGKDGTIQLAFGDRAIEDGKGADFIVYENAFFVGGNPDQVYEELAEVSVSRDGTNWKTFSCDTKSKVPNEWPGCAGWHPTRDYDPTATVPPKPGITGGDPFDLSDVGLERARYVRIRSLSDKGGGTKVGFDLDAVGIANPEVLR